MKRFIILLLFISVSIGNTQYDSGRPKPTFNLGGDIAKKNRIMGNKDSYNLSFITGGIHRLHISSDGKVGIGTTTPTALLELAGNIKITGGAPALDKVLTSDADGLAIWKLPSGGGFTDVGTTIILTNINDDVGIGTSSPNAKLDVTGTPGTSVGGFASGQFHVTSPATTVNSNSVITGHSSFNGNTQLWYLGSTSSSNNDIAFINRQSAGNIAFHTNGNIRITITSDGNTGFGAATAATVRLAIDDNNTGFSGNGTDLDLITASGGVFKFVDNAMRAGLDASNYLEVGHGGSNSFINQVGTGGMDFRFAGTTKATFTPAGHLHLLTDTDQKHNLKIKTANNANDSGIAWQNSGSNFSQTFFRTDIGGNRSDFIFAIGSDANIDLLTNSFRVDGSVANLGNVEFFNSISIGTTVPAASAILDISSTTKGLLPPRMTTAQIDAISSPANGLVAFDTDENKLRLREGTVWRYVNSGRIEGQFSGLNDQAPATTTPIVLTFEANDIPLFGLSHSTTVNPGQFTATITRTFTWQLAPQWEKTTAAGTDTLDFFVQLDTGSGFTTITNSNVKVISGEVESNVIFLSISVPMNVDDIIRFMFRSSNPPNLQTTAFPASGIVALTPSQILNVF